MTEKKRIKILVIMGSPRRGNTFHACEELSEKMQKYCSADFEYLWLKDSDLQPCRGCLVCFTGGEDKCPIHDDAPEIERRMMEADGVVFASPVYGMNVTGYMKIFIDRFSYIFHRPRFFGKKAFMLATAGVIGHKDVLKYMASVARLWGFDVAGKAGLVTEGRDTHSLKEKNSARLETAAREFSSALMSKKRKRPGFMDIVIFHAQKGTFSQIKEESPYDYEYWEGKGWLAPDAHYFTDVPVNPFYVLVGIIVEKLAIRQMWKD